MKSLIMIMIAGALIGLLAKKLLAAKAAKAA